MMRWRVLVVSIVALLPLGLRAGVRPELGSETLAASFDGHGASLALGSVRASIGAVALGRGEARAPLQSGEPVADGLHEVREARGLGVVEWWREVEAGLEHGLTLTERPPGVGALVVDVAVAGLEAHLLDDDAIELARDGVPVATYAGLTVFDARGTRVPARMRMSGALVSLVVDDDGARYPLVIDPLITAQEASLRASDGAAQDDFGSAVALSADATRAVVGVPRDDVGAVVDTGSARVWRRSGTVWMEEATLAASEGATLDFHGSAVALTADASLALIGAYGDFTTPSARTGSVRVFTRTGTTWARSATLIPSDGGNGDSFGQAVALSSDGSRAVIGAPNDTTAGAVNGGSGRIFLRTGTTWTEEATLVPPGAARDDRMGGAVAISADGSRAILGAPSANTSSGIQWGSVRIFARTGTSWVYETGFEPVLRGCGRSVALSSDGARALVGCAGGGIPAPGGVYVYVRSGTLWSQEALLTATDGAAGDYFGSAVALSADGTRAVIGARSDDVGANVDQGSVRVFSRRGTTWVEEATLLAPDGVAGDQLGDAVALSADGSRAIFGIPFDETPAGTRAGTARVFTIVGSNGSPCEGDAACSSGFCALGTCCSTRCGAACEACSAALTDASDGTCGLYTAAAASAVVCRAASTSCDAAESCTSSSSACPSDGPAVSGTICRPIASACDVAETCSGTSSVCPSDGFEGAGVPCRLAATGCDAVELCTGTGALCPADLVNSSGTVCRAAAGACDAEERCDGVAGACPGDARLPPGVSCGTGVGACSTPGICDGVSTSCPGGTPLPDGTACRPATPGTPCDVDDTCDGVSDVCSSRFAPASTVCGAASVGVCDTPDHCAGTSADCLPTFLSAIECRSASGPCDAPERCPGDTPSCPPDVVEASGQVCRGSTDPSCDPDESCDGTSTACPVDVTSCSVSDGGSLTDAPSDSDAGVPTAAAGCACRAGHAARPGTGVAVALTLAFIFRRRRSFARAFARLFHDEDQRAPIGAEQAGSAVDGAADHLRGRRDDAGKQPALPQTVTVTAAPVTGVILTSYSPGFSR